MKRKMVALVIGNAAYPDPDDLDNPVHDAVDLGAQLEHFGFDVTVARDCTFKEMDKRLKEFRAKLKDNDVALFFFAGHGVQVNGVNYLMALDTDGETEDDAKHSSLSLDRVVEAMANSTAATRIIILDACRKNPWERRWHRGPGMRGLASVYAPKGTIIGFGTSPGEVAYDGKGRNGTYTAALLEHIDTPDCSIEMMFKRVRNTVAAATKGKQTSWEHTSLSGEFYFNLGIGNLIEEYDETALADRLFVVDRAKRSHQIIEGLRSHNWYTQNDAISKLDAASVTRMGKNSLFVLGRNIYQAACGGANDAVAFVENFMGATSGYPDEQRKPILDGILFEVFFDKHGEPRTRVKDRYFEDVFELQQYEALKESFDFIADALIATGGDFYSVPGKGHELAVTISTVRKADGVYVDAIYIDGKNVLRIEEQWASLGVRYASADVDELRASLCSQLLLPDRLLKLTFTSKRNAEDELLIRRHWTVRKISPEGTAAA